MIGYSESCERNKDPILKVLLDVFTVCSNILEIGSGTGQHAVYFGLNLPHLIWQPSDLKENLEGIRERIQIEGTENVKPPAELDVSDLPWKVCAVDGVFTANTLHIMPEENIPKLFSGLNVAMLPGGVLCLYGPFRYGGNYTSISNEHFDEILREKDPRSGIRDFEYINSIAGSHGFQLLSDYKMPANNQCIVWEKIR